MKEWKVRKEAVGTEQLILSLRTSEIFFLFAYLLPVIYKLPFSLPLSTSNILFLLLHPRPFFCIKAKIPWFSFFGGGFCLVGFVYNKLSFPHYVCVSSAYQVQRIVTAYIHTLNVG